MTYLEVFVSLMGAEFHIYDTNAEHGTLYEVYKNTYVSKSFVTIKRYKVGNQYP